MKSEYNILLVSPILSQGKMLEDDPWAIEFSRQFPILFQRVLGLQCNIRVEPADALNPGDADACFILANDKIPASFQDAISGKLSGLPMPIPCYLLGTSRVIPEDIPGFIPFPLLGNDQEEKSATTGKPDILRMIDLVYDLKSKLDSNSKEKSFSIYLCETSPDMDIGREKIKNELLQHGFNVLPDSPLPKESNEFKNQFFNHLSNCRLIIHPVGRLYGEVLEGQKMSKTIFQHHLANDFVAEKSKNGNPGIYRLIWLPSVLQKVEEKQDLFIRQLKKEADLLQEAEIIQSPLEDFKSILLERLESDAPLLEVNKKETGDQKHVYLIHEQNDLDKINEIASMLKSEGFVPRLSHFEAQQNPVKIHRDNLVNSHAILIFYNGKNQWWLRSKLNDVIKAPGYGKTEPFLAKAVLLTNGATENIDIYGDIQALQGANMKETISPFLNNLKEKGD